jgi:beta-phosphoglucomutase
VATIDLVVFDMDGVLADLCEIHRLALRSALSYYGFIITPEDEAALEGRPTWVKLQELGIHEWCRDPVATLKQRETLRYLAGLKPDAERVAALKSLRDQGIATALYTNSIRQTAETAMYNLGLASYFDLIISNQDVSAPKPDPEGYTRAMSDLCVLPQRTLIVEDSDVGIEAATLSGAHVVRVSSPSEVTASNLNKWISACT